MQLLLDLGLASDELQLLELYSNLLLQGHIGHCEEGQAKDWLERGCFHSGAFQVDLAESSITFERVFENSLSEVDQESMLVAKLRMKLTELSQLSEPLDLLLTLLRVQVLLDLAPICKGFVFLDLAEGIIHAGEGFEQEA